MLRGRWAESWPDRIIKAASGIGMTFPMILPAMILSFCLRHCRAVPFAPFRGRVLLPTCAVRRHTSPLCWRVDKCNFFTQPFLRGNGGDSPAPQRLGRPACRSAPAGAGFLLLRNPGQVSSIISPLRGSLLSAFPIFHLVPPIGIWIRRSQGPVGSSEGRWVRICNCGNRHAGAAG